MVQASIVIVKEDNTVVNSKIKMDFGVNNLNIAVNNFQEKRENSRVVKETIAFKIVYRIIKEN